MLLLGFFLLSVVVGVVLGVGWRLYESRCERKVHEEETSRQEAIDRAVLVNVETLDRVSTQLNRFQ